MAFIKKTGQFMSRIEYPWKFIDILQRRFLGLDFSYAYPVKLYQGQLVAIDFCSHVSFTQISTI